MGGNTYRSHFILCLLKGGSVGCSWSLTIRDYTLALIDPFHCSGGFHKNPLRLVASNTCIHNDSDIHANARLLSAKPATLMIGIFNLVITRIWGV